jgi:hypothetical protein
MHWLLGGFVGTTGPLLGRILLLMNLIRGQWGQVGVALAAAAYFFYYAATSTQWHFIDSVNLVIHEAGHIVFWPFGELMHALGGSLFQILFPLVYVGYFYFKKQYFSASLLLFWVGQNCINVSVYAGDAILMQLPLLGGDSSMHDWHAILTMLHALRYTPEVASAFYAGGCIVMLFAAALSLYYALVPTS